MRCHFFASCYWREKWRGRPAPMARLPLIQPVKILYLWRGIIFDALLFVPILFTYIFFPPFSADENAGIAVVFAGRVVLWSAAGHSCWPGHQAVGHPHNTFTFYYLPVLLILWLYFFASILYPYSSLHNLLFHFNPFFPFLTNIFNLLIFFLLISSSIYS